MFIAANRDTRKSVVGVGFDAEGNLVATTNNETILTKKRTHEPRPDQAFPHPASSEDLDHFSIPSIFRHELGHHSSRDDNRVDSETAINEAVAQQLQEAWNGWEASEFSRLDPTGDRGYSIVVSIPLDKGGGYVLG